MIHPAEGQGVPNFPAIGRQHASLYFGAPRGRGFAHHPGAGFTVVKSTARLALFPEEIREVEFSKTPWLSIMY